MLRMFVVANPNVAPLDRVGMTTPHEPTDEVAMLDSMFYTETERLTKMGLFAIWDDILSADPTPEELTEGEG